MNFTYDPTDSKPTKPRTRILTLYESRGIVPCAADFQCPSTSVCSAGALRRRRPFRTGNWAYVGSRYGSAQVGGRRTRILFVAMDRGGSSRADLESFAETQRQFRLGAQRRWNPHMGGVSLIMAALVDEPENAPYALQFALTNAVKCIEETGNMKTVASTTMQKRCADHLAEEIKALRPDVVITQGDHPHATVTGLLGATRAEEFMTEGHRQTVTLYSAGERHVLATPHPARLKGLKWRRGSIPPYFLDGIGELRRRWAGLAT